MKTVSDFFVGYCRSALCSEQVSETYNNLIQNSTYITAPKTLLII